MYLLWKGAKDNLESLLSFHHVGSADQTREEVLRLIAAILTHRAISHALDEVGGLFVYLFWLDTSCWKWNH